MTDDVEGIVRKRANKRAREKATKATEAQKAQAHEAANLQKLLNELEADGWENISNRDIVLVPATNKGTLNKNGTVCFHPLRYCTAWTMCQHSRNLVCNDTANNIFCTGRIDHGLNSSQGQS